MKPFFLKILVHLIYFFGNLISKNNSFSCDIHRIKECDLPKSWKFASESEREDGSKYKVYRKSFHGSSFAFDIFTEEEKNYDTKQAEKSVIPDLPF